jgi:Mce-associated membrane protein
VIPDRPLRTVPDPLQGAQPGMPLEDPPAVAEVDSNNSDGDVRRTPTRRWYRRRIGFVAIVLLIAVVGLAAVDVVLRSRVSGEAAINHARSQAVATAKTEVPAVLSYSYRDLSSYPATAESRTTGTFKTALTTLINTAVLPAAMKKHIVTSTTITATSVVHTTSHTVVLLMFIDQQTTSTSLKTPQLEGSRVRVVMSRVGTRWLISQFQPV